MLRRLIAGVIVLILLLPQSIWAAGAPESQTLSGDPPGVRLIHADSRHIILEYVLARYSVVEVQEAGQTWQQVRVPDHALSTRPGWPQLPLSTAMLGIPANVIYTLTIRPIARYRAPGRYHIYPAPREVATRLPDDTAPDSPSSLVEPGTHSVFYQDTAAYTKDGFWPEAVANLVDDGFLRDQRYLLLALYPFQYNPVRGYLYVNYRFRVEVRFSPQKTDKTTAWQSVPAGDRRTSSYERMLSTALLNYEQARAWRVRPVPKDTSPFALRQESVPGADWYKITITQTGFYHLKASDLAAAGMPIANTDPRQLQLWDEGREIPVRYLGNEADGHFDATDAILFYAEARPSAYAAENILWLTVGTTPGLRMDTEDGTPPADVAPTSTCRRLVHAEQNHYYKYNVPWKEEEDRWYWEYVILPADRAKREFELQLPGLVTTEHRVWLRGRFIGETFDPKMNPDHHIRLTINNHLLGDMWWDGRDEYVAELTFPSSILTPTHNILIAEEPGDANPYDSVYFDWFEIEYLYRPDGHSGYVTCADPWLSQRRLRLSGFPSSDIEVYDVTDSANVRVLTGIQVTGRAGDYQVDFGHGRLGQPTFLPLVVAAPGSGRQLSVPHLASSTLHYVALTPSAWRRPAAVVKDRPSKLASPSNSADWIAITHRDFLTATQRLAAWRQSLGLRAVVVDVQDIYDEFNDGVMHPKAIRDFLAYAYANWAAPAPQYVLLVGDGHRDPRNFVGDSPPVKIPIYSPCVDPWMCAAASDNWYVTLVGNDRLPEMHIGRLPVATEEQAEQLVDKIIAYESSAPLGDWRVRHLFVADNAYDAYGQYDGAGRFDQLSDSLISTRLGPMDVVTRAYYDPYPGDDQGEPYRYRTPEETTTAIASALNAGQLIISYIGHGWLNFWAG
ncbi:MAG TPA: hypothetical protein EYH31_01685, partial [Anaerolineae bacterium]|nr:hypothetical protein [Anaerolineae bacterium]